MHGVGNVCKRFSFFLRPRVFKAKRERTRKVCLKSEKFFFEELWKLTAVRGARYSYELFTRNIPIVSLLFIINLNFRVFLFFFRYSPFLVDFFFFWMYEEERRESTKSFTWTFFILLEQCSTVAGCTKYSLSPKVGQRVSELLLGGERWIPFPCIFLVLLYFFFYPPPRSPRVQLSLLPVFHAISHSIGNVLQIKYSPTLTCLYIPHRHPARSSCSFSLVFSSSSM